jgi:hypothetical protein
VAADLDLGHGVGGALSGGGVIPGDVVGGGVLTFDVMVTDTAVS